MKNTRIRISKDITQKLKMLQGRTGLTPNILLRIGFGLSLNNKSYIDPKEFKEDGMELNRYTVSGEFDDGFIAILKEWLILSKKQVNEDSISNYFRAHLNRGAVLLSGRVKSIIDLVYLE